MGELILMNLLLVKILLENLILDLIQYLVLPQKSYGDFMIKMAPKLWAGKNFTIKFLSIKNLTKF